MVRKSADKLSNSKKMFGGAGEIKMQLILEGPEEMQGKGRVFDHVVIEPGCEIGWHVHESESETYYILKGQGQYNDNGQVVTVGPGDVTVVGVGQGHSMINNGTENLEMIALILFS